MRPTCLYRMDLWFCLNLDNKVLGMTNMKNFVTINLSSSGYRENLRLKTFLHPHFWRWQSRPFRMAINLTLIFSKATPS